MPDGSGARNVSLDITQEMKEPSIKKARLSRYKYDPSHKPKSESDSETNSQISASGDANSAEEMHIEFDELVSLETPDDPFYSHFFLSRLSDEKLKGSYTSLKTPMRYLGERSILYLQDIESHRGPKVFRSINDMHIIYQLSFGFNELVPQPTPFQLELAQYVCRYRDVLLSSRSWKNFEEIQQVYVMHVLNHIFKSLTIVNAHSKKLAENEDLEFRDQGFTRPKVLILLPTRNSALVFIRQLFRMSGLVRMDNKKRFEEAFSAEVSGHLSNKPLDHQKLFEGNSDDMFCLGVKFMHDSLRLYTPFYDSDMIVASPLSLRVIVAAEDSNRKPDYDFLSSIEICIVDQADAIQMQSWQNLAIVISHLNRIPKEAHDCDFSRVRKMVLEQQGQYVRQTLLISAYETPEMVNLFLKSCNNFAGKLRARQKYGGAMASTAIKVRQLFKRLEAPNPMKDMNIRFEYFTTTLIPSLLRDADRTGTLIVVSEYSDFVRLRNYFDKEDFVFAAISEYTPISQVARARSHFSDGRVEFMLYTQRLHHYRRYNIKGVKHVLFYGLPDNPQFYIEIVRFLARTVIESDVDPDVMKVTIMYSKWDAMKLERIVGTTRVGQLISGVGETHEFY